jgi:hypothetical protein
MVRRPAGRRRIYAIEPKVAQFQRIDEHIDRANRIALVDPIIEAFRQQRRLLAIRPLNKTLHRFPRRFSSRIIASTRFSHSLGHNRTHATQRSALKPPALWSGAQCKSDCPNFGYDL